jgi:hypothetical protein
VIERGMMNTPESSESIWGIGAIIGMVISIIIATLCAVVVFALLRRWRTGQKVEVRPGKAPDQMHELGSLVEDSSAGEQPYRRNLCDRVAQPWTHREGSVELGMVHSLHTESSDRRAHSPVAPEAGPQWMSQQATCGCAGSAADESADELATHESVDTQYGSTGSSACVESDHNSNDAGSGVRPRDSPMHDTAGITVEGTCELGPSSQLHDTFADLTEPTTRPLSPPPPGAGLSERMQFVHHQLDSLTGREILQGLRLLQGPSARLQGGVEL